MTGFTESVVEEAALAWLESLGWSIRHGAEMALDLPGAERADYGQVVLAKRRRDALAKLNPDLPAEALEDAFRKIVQPEGAMLEARNRAAHRALVNGVTVEYRRRDGSIAGLRPAWSILRTSTAGADKRLKIIAEDIVDHFEKRLEVMDGKGHDRVHESAHCGGTVPRADSAAACLA